VSSRSAATWPAALLAAASIKLILASTSTVATAVAHIAITPLIFPPWNQLVMTTYSKEPAEWQSVQLDTAADRDA
jgi:hypothetical protein